MQNLANRSYLKSQKLKAVRNGHRLLHEQDCHLAKKTYKYVKIHNELYVVKQECIRETWLLIKEIENLEMDKKSLEERIQSLHKKNKALVKNHQGNFLWQMCFLFTV